MGTIQLDFSIDAPLERVSALYRRLDLIPRWQYDILEVKNAAGISGGLIDRAGATYTLVYGRFGRRLDQHFTVTQFEPPHRMQQTGNTPLGGQVTSTTCLEEQEGRTRIHWQMDYLLPGGVLGELVDRLFFRAVFRRTVMAYNRNFKEMAEGVDS
jgi:uncharacterized membrane protein